MLWTHTHTLLIAFAHCRGELCVADSEVAQFCTVLRPNRQLTIGSFGGLFGVSSCSPLTFRLPCVAWQWQRPAHVWPRPFRSVPTSSWRSESQVDDSEENLSTCSLHPHPVILRSFVVLPSHWVPAAKESAVPSWSKLTLVHLRQVGLSKSNKFLLGCCDWKCVPVCIIRSRICSFWLMLWIMAKAFRCAQVRQHWHFRCIKGINDRRYWMLCSEEEVVSTGWVALSTALRC